MWKIANQLDLVARTKFGSILVLFLSNCSVLLYESAGCE